MSVNTSAIRDLLLPGLRAVEAKYEKIPTQWKKYLDHRTSDMAIERVAEMRMLGLAAIKQEGAPTTFDNGAGQRFVYNAEHTEIGLGFAVTRKAIDDNLYKSQFPLATLNLNEAFAQTKEIISANLLNTANVYDSKIGGDGVALISTNHPYDGGTWSNTTSTPADFNETGLEVALSAIRTNAYDQAGLKLFIRGRKLLVPVNLQWIAARLCETELRPGTADNDLNAIQFTGALEEGYEVLDFLTSAYAWYILTTRKGLRYYQRTPYETDMHVDPTTGNLMVTGYERYSATYDDPHALWASFPTS